MIASLDPVDLTSDVDDLNDFENEPAPILKVLQLSQSDLVTPKKRVSPSHGRSTTDKRVKLERDDPLDLTSPPQKPSSRKRASELRKIVNSSSSSSEDEEGTGDSLLREAEEAGESPVIGLNVRRLIPANQRIHDDENCEEEDEEEGEEEDAEELIEEEDTEEHQLFDEIENRLTEEPEDIDEEPDLAPAAPPKKSPRKSPRASRSSEPDDDLSERNGSSSSLRQELADLEEDIKAQQSRLAGLLARRDVVRAQLASHQPVVATARASADEPIVMVDLREEISSSQHALEASLTSVAEEPLSKWQGERFPHSRELRLALERTFRFSTFRELQLEAMNASMCGRDVFCVLPTGSGKSLLYQLPAIVQGGITLVISPLISLSQDQVLNSSKRGIVSKYLSSDQTPSEREAIYASLRDPTSALRLVYVTPEMVAKSKKFIHCLDSLNERGGLTRIAVDEAHCCSTLGHDFRPDYPNIFALKQRYPRVPLLCVTATATKQVEEDIFRMVCASTRMDPTHQRANWSTFRSSFNRPNLMYSVVDKSSESVGFLAQLAALVGTRFKDQCGIVYCYSRADTETYAQALKDANVSCEAYHARLDSARRRRVHEAWRDGKIRVVCATTAFGMGIDKPNVRFVVHSTLPSSMEGYVQESGRAGRDGLAAHVVLMYRRGDISRVSSLISDARCGATKLLEMVAFAESGHECRRVLIGRSFGEAFDRAACKGTCDSCAVSLTQRSLLEPSKALDMSKHRWVEQDHTLEAESLLRCLIKLKAAQAVPRPATTSRRAKLPPGITMIQLVDAWRGTGKDGDVGLPFRAPKKWPRSACDRLVIWMLVARVLELTWRSNKYATNMYVDLGERAQALLRQKQLGANLYIKYSSLDQLSGASDESTTPKRATKASKASSSVAPLTLTTKKPAPLPVVAAQTVPPTTSTASFQRPASLPKAPASFMAYQPPIPDSLDPFDDDEFDPSEYYSNM